MVVLCKTSVPLSSRLEAYAGAGSATWWRGRLRLDTVVEAAEPRLATAREGTDMQLHRAILAALCLLAAPACADPISGYVHANGRVAIPSSLYTVTHPERGMYTITFTTPVAPMASCVVMLIRGEDPIQRRGYGPFVVKLTESDRECSFVIRNSGNNPRVNEAFTFIAVPMSN
jgi:hypothetical protein